MRRLSTIPSSVRRRLGSVFAPVGAPTLSDWDYARMAPIRVANRAFVNGFPGSGNVTLQHVVNGLLGAAPASEDVPSPALAFFAPRYTRLLALLKSCLPREWAENAYFSTHQGGGRVDFIAAPDDRRFLFAGPFDLGVHMNAPCHATHELPRAAHYEMFASFGMTILPIVRHPLDTLASLAAKTRLTVEEERCVREEKDPARQQALAAAARLNAERARLGNARWLSVAGEALTRTLRAHSRLQSRWKVWRYEDMLADPPGFVSAIARQIGVETDEATCLRLAGAIGTTEFVRSHFNRPAAMKWPEKFNSDQLAILGRLGLFEAAEELGYQTPTQADLVPQPAGAGERDKSAAAPAEAVRFFNITMLAQIFDPAWIVDLADVREHVALRRCGALSLFASQDDIAAEFSDRLGKAALRHVA